MKRLNGATASLAIVITCLPIAVIITIFTSSFWQWIELHFKVEAYGYSGPAGWCYVVSYSILIVFSTLAWSHLKNKSADAS